MKNRYQIYENLSFLAASLVFIFYIYVVFFFTKKMIPVYIDYLDILFTRGDFFGSIRQMCQESIFVFVIASFPVFSYIWFRIISSFYRILSIRNRTIKYVKSTINTSNNLRAFTYGFLTRNIFLSEKTYSILNSKEIEMLSEHENHHKKNFDNLKILFLNFYILCSAPFPLKYYLFGKFRLLQELSADLQVIDKYNKNDYCNLLEKFLSVNIENKLLISSISSINKERIEILINKKKFEVKGLLVIFFMLNIFSFFALLSISKVNAKDLYQCNSRTIVCENQSKKINQSDAPILSELKITCEI